MNLISLYYFSELAKDLNMTQTANRLFISQQTLSNHIHRLEEYYGIQLFHRKPALALTSAGEFVLSFAQSINKEHANLKDILSDVEKQERGVIRFGASTMRMSTCLPSILPQFAQQFPDVEIRITDTISPHLESKVLDDLLDFAIIVGGDAHPKLITEHLIDDQIFLCVPDNLLQNYYGDRAQQIKAEAVNGAYVENFIQLPFCTFSNRMGRQIQRCFDEARVTPRSLITSTYTQIGTTVCFQHLAACFATQISLMSQKDAIPHDLNIFPLYLQGAPVVQQTSLIRLKDRYLPRYSKHFLTLLTDYFAGVEKIHLERVV